MWSVLKMYWCWNMIHALDETYIMYVYYLNAVSVYVNLINQDTYIIRNGASSFHC